MARVGGVGRGVEGVEGEIESCRMWRVLAQLSSLVQHGGVKGSG